MLKKLEYFLEKRWIVILSITILTLIAYCNSFQVPFILDDFGSIANNYSIHSPLQVSDMWQFYSNRFVLYFTLSLNYVIHDTHVVGYHIVNTLIHIVNGILLFFILKSILGLSYFKGKLLSKYKNLVSTLAVLVFVCHPIQVNAVTYIIQRTASLAAMFYFMAILFFIKYRTKDKSKYLIFTLLSTILAMYTKENAITIPFMLLGLEILFFLKDGKTSIKKRFFMFFILFLTIPIIPVTAVFLHGYSQSDPNASFKASTDMNRFVYFYTELNVIVLYIKQLFLPLHQNFDYSNDFPKSYTLWDHHSYVSLSILSLIGIYGFINIRKNKLIALGIFWFYLGLAVESSFISIKDVYFEHRLYFPTAGFIIAIIGILFKKRPYLKRTFIVKKTLPSFVIFFVIAILFFTTLTLRRNYIYSDGIRLWTDVVKKAPNSDRSHSVLGKEYLDKYSEKDEKNGVKDPHGYLKKSEAELKLTLTKYPKNDTARSNLSLVYYYQEKYKECIDESKQVISHTKSVYAYRNIAMAYKKLGKMQDAINAYEDGYKVDKKRSFILKGLGDCYFDTKNFKKAKFYYEEYLKQTSNKEIKTRLEKIKNSP